VQIPAKRAVVAFDANSSRTQLFFVSAMKTFVVAASITMAVGRNHFASATPPSTYPEPKAPESVVTTEVVKSTRRNMLLPESATSNEPAYGEPASGTHKNMP